MQINIKNSRLLKEWNKQNHKKDTQVYRVVEYIAIKILCNSEDIESNDIIKYCKEKGYKVSHGYIRQIFSRLFDKGILKFSEATNKGKRLILFCASTVTRQIENKLLDFKKLRKKEFTKQIGHKKPFKRGFLGHIFSNKEYIEINPITNEQIKKEVQIKQHNNKRLLSTRFFQTENFRVSYKKLQGNYGRNNYGEYSRV